MKPLSAWAQHVLLRVPSLLLLLVLATGAAMAQSDPPARVASLSHREGSVVFAPAGETQWQDVPLNRPLTRGDRLWTDAGGRAEVHLGSAVLHVDSETFLDIIAVDDDVLQASLNEGSVNARVRQLANGDNFEIDTPQLAFRAVQPGDYRIDVDPAQGTTRVRVRSGAAMLYGAGRGSMALRAGDQITLAGRDLQAVSGPSIVQEDNFGRWAADRNRQEDQSIAARFVPREVVGYQQLDAHGVWSQDPNLGPIWFPRVTVADWAPYRYGHWEWIAPWGWTWIDDAPWGFAPFHYGRWTQVGPRWAWVPGRLGPRPVYAPALVMFVGGSGTNWNLSIGNDPGIAWLPLAPGEPWWPGYRTSTVYLRSLNHGMAGPAPGLAHSYPRQANALTAVPLEDFSRGRPVHSTWRRIDPAIVPRGAIGGPSVLPPPPRRAIVEAPPSQPPSQSMTPGVPRPGAVAPPGIARQVVPQRVEPPRPTAPPSVPGQRQPPPAAGITPPAPGIAAPPRLPVPRAAPPVSPQQAGPAPGLSQPRDQRADRGRDGDLQRESGERGREPDQDDARGRRFRVN